jgi:hypothetical protein
MAYKSVSINIGGPLMGLLGVVLVVLKLANYPPVGDWSWWAVTAPFWVPFVLIVTVFVVLGVMIALAALIAAWLDR